MIEHIKLKDYKGIKEVQLNGLKHINVICGRNSSGKSSVLEAMEQKEKYSIGAPFLPKKILEVGYDDMRKYSSPPSSYVLTWFERFLNEYSEDNHVVYLDDNQKFNEAALQSIRRNQSLNSYGTDYGASAHFDRYLNSFRNEFKPILIPPKRILHTKTKVAPDETLEPNGKGCVNYLFFLKNQDQKSQDFIKFRRIYDTFKSITGQAFNITLGADHHLQLQFESEGQWRSADDCGLGLRDILIIITFVLATEYNVYLIEEPESHLHADFQKKLVSKLLKPAEDKQFILSTHAPIFLEPTTADKIYFCQFSKGQVKVTDEASLSRITDMLGHPVTEVLTSDALIFVEGPTDVPVYKAMLNWWSAMDKYNIRMWPLGGDIMGSLDMATFGGRNNVFAIIDSDPGSRHIRDKFKQACKDAKIPVFQLGRYAIENYFTLPALKAVFGDTIPETVKKINPGTPVDKQLGFSKDKTLKTRNTEVITQMSLQDISGTDLETSLKAILAQIEAVHALKEQQNEVS